MSSIIPSSFPLDFVLQLLQLIRLSFPVAYLLESPVEAVTLTNQFLDFSLDLRKTGLRT